MEQKYEKLEQLMQDQDIAKRLMSASVQDAQKILKEEYQLDFTEEELNDVAAGIRAAVAEDASDELTPEDLEAVSGGAKNSKAYKHGYYIGKAARAAVIIIPIALAMGW